MHCKVRCNSGAVFHWLLLASAQLLQRHYARNMEEDISAITFLHIRETNTMGPCANHTVSEID